MSMLLCVCLIVCRDPSLSTYEWLSPVFRLCARGFHGSTCVKFNVTIFRAHMFTFCHYTTARQIARIAFARPLGLGYDYSGNDAISLLTSVAV
jgi:hypothetical protein